MARAVCLLWGIGVPRDENAGFRVLNTECDTSDPHVQYMLGNCHHRGYGCVKNEPQAVQWYQRAGNHVGALKMLGYMFAHGDGAAQDDARAAALHRHVAEQGCRYAQYYIASMYEQGKGVPKDLHKAKHWYTLAAEQMHTPANITNYLS
eukprot:TRINITY_DN6812_c0_g3_i1.p1 TRINITY_DN6812_c0_g3~~TRINITY_DN6812_c0_g3_i1.p1  ORF type:complete len:163 (+),score=35.80 TRINITY_DN6812_c0_g3_i1:44-490(+)